MPLAISDFLIKGGLVHPAPLETPLCIYPAFFSQNINSSLKILVW
jgi:hypothetical protein